MFRKLVSAIVLLLAVLTVQASASAASLEDVAWVEEATANAQEGPGEVPRIEVMNMSCTGGKTDEGTWWWGGVHHWEKYEYRCCETNAQGNTWCRDVTCKYQWHNEGSTGGCSYGPWELQEGSKCEGALPAE